MRNIGEILVHSFLSDFVKKNRQNNTPINISLLPKEIEVA
jgi:hypothetical protein